MFSASFHKYRGLFVSTTAFVLFFILYIVVNYAIQRTTVHDIEYANIVTRLQATLVEQGSSANVRKQLQEQLQTIQRGGEIILSDDESIIIEGIDEHLRPAPSNIQNVINALNSSVVNQGSLSQSSLSQSNSSQNLAITAMAQMNALMQEKKTRSIKLLTTLQVIAVILTVLLYFIVIVQIVLQLSKTDIVEVQSKKETEGIMSTISEGIFLLDKQYDIGAEQSDSLKGMFKSEKDLEGNFLDFISQYVTQKNVELAQEYLQLLFGERVKERLVEELNPLKEVEVNIVRRDGSFENHYLDFKFNRVRVDGKISHLLGSVNDVTKQVLLERQLGEVKEAQQAQLDMLKSILHIDSHKLSLYFANVEKILHEVNRSLEVKNKGFSDLEMRKMLDSITAQIHQIKGDSASLGLHKSEFSAHDLEESIVKIKASKSAITGKELLPLTTGLRAMFSDLDDMKELVNKFSDIQVNQTHSTSDLPSEPQPELQPKPQIAASQAIASQEDDNSDQGSLSHNTANEPAETETELDEAQLDAHNVDISESLATLSATVAKRNNKNIALRTHGLDAGVVPDSLVTAVQSIAIQFVRNSIVHGVESEAERLAAQKAAVAIVDVKFFQSKRGYILRVNDDGQGIDEQAIRSRAIAKGIITAEAAGAIPDKKIPSLLFHPDFSSFDEATIDAGRGAGLNLVKTMVNNLGGRINVSYEKGQYCQFNVLFPVVS